MTYKVLLCAFPGRDLPGAFRLVDIGYVRPGEPVCDLVGVLERIFDEGQEDEHWEPRRSICAGDVVVMTDFGEKRYFRCNDRGWSELKQSEGFGMIEVVNLDLVDELNEVPA